jgi:hypothetical protein
MQRALVLALGWGFAVFGALALFDDLLQGILLLLLGLYLLSFEQPWVRDQRAQLERRFPEAAKLLARGEAKLQDLHGRVSGEERERSGGGPRR